MTLSRTQIAANWVDTAVVSAVANHSQSNGGRIIAALASSTEEDRQQLARLYIAAATQIKSDESHRFLAELAGNPTGTRPDSDEETPTLDPARPVIQRPNGKDYYARKWGSEWDVDVLRKSRASGLFVVLFGPPGTGKTAMVEAAFGDELITFVMSAETRLSALIGTWMPDGDNFKWMDGPLTKAVKNGLPIFIDEILLADPTILSEIYPLMDGRGTLEVKENPDIGTVYAQDGFYIIGAGNPNVPGANFSEALSSRFDIHVEVTTDWPLLKIIGVEPNLVDASEALNASATGAAPTLSWSPQFRELEAFKKIEEIHGREFAYRNLMRKFPAADLDEARERIKNIAEGKLLIPAKV